MKILELNIVEFGCLKDKKIKLGESLNIISGNNESGKSTVMLFIRFMLYGLPARRSARSVDRERSLNWESKRAAGTMLVEKGGKKYFIERRAVSSGTKLNESLKITDFATGEVIEGEAGELLLGVPAEVFDNSCFIAQMRSGDINRAQTASAIENMLASADESIDVSDVIKKLDKVKKEYKHERGEGGKLYETQQRITALKIKERSVSEQYTSYNAQSAELERKASKLSDVEESLKKSKATVEQIEKGQILLRFDALEQRKNELEGKRAELDVLIAGATRNGFTPDATHAASLRGAASDLNDAIDKHSVRFEEYKKAEGAELADEQLASLGERIEAAGGKSSFLSVAENAAMKAKRLKAAGGVCLGLVVPSALAVIALRSVTVAAIAFIALAVVLIAAGVACFASSSAATKRAEDSLSELGVKISEAGGYVERCLAELAKKRACEQRLVEERVHLSSAEDALVRYRERLSELVEKTVTDVPSDDGDMISLALSEARRTDEFCQGCAELSSDIRALGTVIESECNALSQYDEGELRQFVVLDVSALTPQAIAKARQTYEFDRQRHSMLAGQVAHLREHVAALRGGLTHAPTEITDEIYELEARLAADSEYYSALALARAHVEAASMAMSGNVTPQISRQAGELLNTLSDGKHAFMQTTKNLDISIEQDGFTASIEQFSGGTQDAAYIALRIALMLRLFGSELPPLLLDESLCQMDDVRAKNMLRALSKIAASTAQCIIFTCHSREKLACDELGIDVTLTQM